MQNKSNVSDISDCYGCGVCAVACPKKIIDVKLNEEGFYQAYIKNEGNCTHCGICREVCAYSYDDISVKKPVSSSYAAWSKNEKLRITSATGGVCTELSLQALNEGLKVCAVKYDLEREQTRHYIIDSIDELKPAVGSKYTQSYTVDGFKKIDRKNNYLVIGTPCQIDSFRRYIRRYRIEDNFILVDLFCHGVISMNVWIKYFDEIKKIVGSPDHVSWRNKYTIVYDDNGYRTVPIDWHQSYNIIVKGNKGLYQNKLADGDGFYRFFISNKCLGKACYEHCKYRYDQSAADIRVGDLWGKTYQDNTLGVNSVVSFSEKGNQLLRNSNCELTPLPFEIVAEGQMKSPPNIKLRNDKIIKASMKKDVTIDDLTRIISREKAKDFYLQCLKHPLYTINLIIRKITRK